MKLFENRVEAGRRLGQALAGLDVRGEVVVLGLPRGGVPVACEVGAALGAPVDVLVVRKLGAPFNPELAVGAIAFGGITVLNRSLAAELGLDERSLQPIVERERAELLRREHAYRRGKAALDIAGKTAVIVDDGMATGATMRAAVAAARELGPAAIIVAVPTAAEDTVSRLERVADRVVALATPEPYYGVGAWYADFAQLTDRDVLLALERAARARAEAPGGDARRESAA
jgi:predicted phosphoribosyltransferase